MKSYIQILSEVTGVSTKIIDSQKSSKYNILTISDTLKAMRLAVEQANGWVKVEDGLPEKNGYYIAFAVNPYKEPGLFHFNLTTGWQNRGFYMITHWMPLPAPPTK